MAGALACDVGAQADSHAFIVRVLIRSSYAINLSSSSATRITTSAPLATFVAHPASPSVPRCRDVHLQLLQEKDGFTPIQLVVSTYQSLQELMKHVEVGQSWLELVCEAVGTSSELVLRPSATRSDDSTRLPSVRRMTLAERIKSQIEWYLDPDRMAADRFLVEQARQTLSPVSNALLSPTHAFIISPFSSRVLCIQARDHSDWVPISQVLSFPRMRKLCHVRRYLEIRTPSLSSQFRLNTRPSAATDQCCCSRSLLFLQIGSLG